MTRNILCFFIALFTITNVFSREIHVAKNGSNSNPGTKAAPYQTIQKAASVAVAGDVVIIHAGTYEETLAPQNSGSAGRPITFKSAEGDKVIISAMQALSNWTHDKNKVYKTRVTWDLGQDNMVLHGNKLMDLARWPNNTSKSPFPLTYNKMTSGGKDYVEYAPGIPSGNWAKGGSIYFYGGAGFLAWKEFITSSNGKRVYFKLKRNQNWIEDKHHPAYTGHGRHAGEFILAGIREALDYQNEWYYDKATKMLFVQTENGTSPKNGSVMMRKRTLAISLKKNHINIEGLAVFGGSIEMNSNNCKLYKVSSFYGNYTLGVFSNFGSKRQSVLITGKENKIDKCEIAYGAGSGVYDKGEKTRLENSYIHHFNFLGSYDCVLNSRGAKGSIYKNNTLQYGGRDIIQAYVKNGEFAYNDIGWSNIVADDCGLLYTTNGPSYSKIHHNLFHDAHAKTGRHKAAGIYLDNDSRDWEVHHNVVWNVDWTNIQINWNGKNLNIYNNTLVKGMATMGAWHKSGTRFSNVKVWNNLTDKAARGAGDQESEVTWEPQADKQNNLIDKSSFVDYAKNDFRLKANSKAIDFGRFVTRDDQYTGAKPDAGAFERGKEWKAGVNWDVKRGPTGNGCYNLPGEVCSGGGDTPSGNDAIVKHTLPSSFVRTKDISFSLDYEVSTTRDIVVELWKEKWIASTTATVSAGKGSKTMSIRLPELPVVGDGYVWKISIRKQGGNWDETIVYKNIKNIKVLEPSKDTINFTQSITTLASKSVYSIDVNYSASTDRDIVVQILKGGKWIANAKKTVNAGKGTASITLNLPEKAVPGNDYILKADIRPKNGDFSTNLMLKELNNIKIGTHKDLVDFAENIKTLTPSASYKFNINYEASQERDIVVQIWKGNTWLAQSRKTVKAGSGSTDVTVNLQTVAAAGTDYKIKIDLRAKNGDWDTHVLLKQINDVVVLGSQLVADGVYEIQSAANGMNLASTKTSNWDAIQTAQKAQNDQRWTFKHLGNNVYTIKLQDNSYGNQYLEVRYGLCENSAVVGTYKEAIMDHHRWKIEKINDQFVLHPAHCLNQALDVNPNKQSVISYAYSSANANQKWKILPVGQITIKETVAFKENITALTPQTTYSVAINYTAKEDRDIVVSLFKGSKWISQGRTSVGKGSSTAKVDIKLNVVPSAGSDYILKADIRPKNGTSAMAIKNTQVNDIKIEEGQLIADGAYRIKSKANGMILAATPRVKWKAVQVNYGNYDDQKWKFKHVGNNVYVITLVASWEGAKILEVPGAWCKNGSPVSTYNRVVGEHQKWKVERVGDTYMLKPNHCLGQASDVYPNSSNIITWEAQSENINQKWEIISADPQKRTLDVDEYSDVCIQVFPNPFVDLIHLNSDIRMTRIELYRADGLLILSEDIDTAKKTISTNQLSDGMYIIKIRTQDHMWSIQKVLKY